MPVSGGEGTGEVGIAVGEVTFVGALVGGPVGGEAGGPVGWCGVFECVVGDWIIVGSDGVKCVGGAVGSGGWITDVGSVIEMARPCVWSSIPGWIITMQP